MKKRQNDSENTASIVTIDPSEPQPDKIRAAVGILNRQGTLIFPTSGLYGLGVDAFSQRAVRRVYAIKARPQHKPLLVLLSGVADLDRLVRSIPEYARGLMNLWPGGITLVFEAAPTVPVELTAGTGKIGVRLPAHPVAKALVEQFGGPITGTSANLAGVPATNQASTLDAALCREVDLIVDAGTLAGGSGSTIVDVTGWPIKVIRDGAVNHAAIQAAMK